MAALLSLALPLSPRAVKALNSLFAQVAARRTLQERLDRGARQRQHRLAAEPAFFRSGLGGGDKTVGQAFAILRRQLHRPVLLVAEQMVAEGGAELRQPLVDLGHPRFGLVVETGAGAVEADVGTLQQPQLLRREIELGADAV